VEPNATFDMRSIITVVKKHAEMLVKHDAGGGVGQISIKSTQSCGG